MNTPIPMPKSYYVTGRRIPLPLTVEAPAAYADAVKVFGDYLARAYGVTLTEGDGGILLKTCCCTDKEYVISVTDRVIITARNAVAANHALATLMQEIFEEDGVLYLPCGEARDLPDSDWRGLMLDLSRCWHEIDFLYRAADLCWLYKMNRLQLHLTDDQGIRFPFRAFPKAVHEDHYTVEQLIEFNAYCKARGIVIVPEIDAPGHARPFNEGHPEIFGAQIGIMSACDTTFEALKTAFAEVAEVFPDSPWIHVGGDEARLNLWEACPETQAFCKEQGIADVHQLYGEYVLRLAEIVKSLGRKPVVWEGFSKDCNARLPKDLTVFAWESLYQLAPDLQEGGFPLLNASWKPLYVCNPKKMWGPEEILDWEKTRWQNWWDQSPASRQPINLAHDAPVDGGQMCSWGDHMTLRSAYAPRPQMLAEEFAAVAHRLPALSEKLWNSYSKPDKAAFVYNLKVSTDLLYRMLSK